MINFNTLHEGDYVEVEIGGNGHLSGGIIKGKIVQIWNDDKLIQAKLESGWCFHLDDHLLTHNETKTGGINHD